MKRRKIIKWIAIALSSIAAIPMLGILLFNLYFFIMMSGIFLPNPPRPEITYAEFPFRIELEHNGERLVFEDTIICEFAGFSTSGGISGDFRRQRHWTSRFGSGREYNTTNPSIDMLITDYVVIRFHSGSPAYYMDRHWSEIEHGVTGSPSPPRIFVDNLEMRARGEFSSNSHHINRPHGQERLADTLEYFGIKVISIELTPRIDNTFQ